jgi:hypothetical protein
MVPITRGEKGNDLCQGRILLSRARPRLLSYFYERTEIGSGHGHRTAGVLVGPNVKTSPADTSYMSLSH